MRTAEKTLIVDNGAYTIKAEYSTADAARIFPNAIMKAKNERKRIFISSQIDECKDLSSLYYVLPFQKGYLVNWDVQHQIWDYIFGKDCLKVDFDETRVVLTEPLFNFRSIGETLNEIIFEEYQFHSALRINAPTLSALQHTIDHPCFVRDNTCVVVVDSGYSFTHIVPYFKGRLLRGAVARISVGGKLLTNHLKEIISYRQLHVMDETCVVNQCKEDACYVSTDFQHDMDRAKERLSENTIVRDYVLPDFANTQKGFLRKPDAKDATFDTQLIRLNHERFAVPEILFRPSDIDLKEMGITEALCHVINRCPQDTQETFFTNICLTGGNTLFDGFTERAHKDVRCSVSNSVDVKVFRPDDPIQYAWRGGASLSKLPVFNEMLVTKAEYEENGHELCKKRYGI